MGGLSVGEIKGYPISSDAYGKNLIANDNLQLDYSRVYSKQCFFAIPSAFAKCFSEPSKHSLYKLGVDGLCIVSHYHNVAPSCLFDEYLIFSTFRPDGTAGHYTLSSDYDPILIPMRNGAFGKYAYRLTHGANVGGWPDKTMLYDELSGTQSLPVDTSFASGLLSCNVPQLSNQLADPVGVFESQYPALSNTYPAF